MGPHFYNLDNGQVSGAPYYWYDDHTYQMTASAKVSHFADRFLGASHDFKFGIQYVNGGVHDAVSGYERPHLHLYLHRLLRKLVADGLRLRNTSPTRTAAPPRGWASSWTTRFA